MIGVQFANLLAEGKMQTHWKPILALDFLELPLYYEFINYYCQIVFAVIFKFVGHELWMYIYATTAKFIFMPKP